MLTATWKTHERKLATLFGTQRTGNTGKATADFETDCLSCEVKHTSRPPATLLKALQQARRNASSGRTPLVVLHPHGASEYYVFLTLTDLLQLIKVQEYDEHNR
jgi:hypothetical protein